jgi:hypothetical protein
MFLNRAGLGHTLIDLKKQTELATGPVWAITDPYKNKQRGRETTDATIPISTI